MIRRFLVIEGAGFVAWALVHFGVLVQGYEDPGAAVPESIIAAVLLGGAALTFLVVRWTRAIGIAAQAFALVGTLIGTYLAVIGVAPDTALDIAFHVAMLALLLWGLVATVRSRTTLAA